jgi:hypothetical protein
MYVLKRDIPAIAVDDSENARFPEEPDTVLLAGVEFDIVKDRHNWPPHPPTETFYTIESRSSFYNVRADQLDAAMEKVA